MKSSLKFGANSFGSPPTHLTKYTWVKKFSDKIYKEEFSKLQTLVCVY